MNNATANQNTIGIDISVIDENANKIETKAIAYFTLLSNGKKYLFYTHGEIVKNSLIKIYVAETTEIANMAKPISDNEWSQLKDIMGKLSSNSGPFDNLLQFNKLSEHAEFYVGSYKKIGINNAVETTIMDAQLKNQPLEESTTIKPVGTTQFFDKGVLEDGPAMVPESSVTNDGIEPSVNAFNITPPAFTTVSAAPVAPTPVAPVVNTTPPVQTVQNTTPVAPVVQETQVIETPKAPVSPTISVNTPDVDSTISALNDIVTDNIATVPTSQTFDATIAKNKLSDFLTYVGVSKENIDVILNNKREDSKKIDEVKKEEPLKTPIQPTSTININDLKMVNQSMPKTDSLTQESALVETPFVSSTLDSSNEVSAMEPPEPVKVQVVQTSTPPVAPVVSTPVQTTPSVMPNVEFIQAQTPTQQVVQVPVTPMPQPMSTPTIMATPIIETPMQPIQPQVETTQAPQVIDTTPTVLTSMTEPATIDLTNIPTITEPVNAGIEEKVDFDRSNPVVLPNNASVSIQGDVNGLSPSTLNPAQDAIQPKVLVHNNNNNIAA
ncbi:MAG TPA: hypothetical protein PLC25_01510 [Bacilli bacterium]|nr:hypothetical protein [Bacilli bacterium]